MSSRARLPVCPASWNPSWRGKKSWDLAQQYSRAQDFLLLGRGIYENLPLVIIAACDHNDSASVLRYEETLPNLQEVKMRSGKFIAIATRERFGDLEGRPTMYSQYRPCRNKRKNPM